MFNRNDPLINSVKKVMAENETRRQAERDLNEELGIDSKRALPFEHHANYDALLEQKIAEALKGDQHKIDANQNNKIDSQDFKILKAKKEIEEAIGDKEGTAGTLRKDGKPVVPDATANNPFMQASPDKAPMPPERPKDLDKSAPMPTPRPKDLNEISRDLARRVIRKASDEKEMGSKKDRSKAIVLAGKKAYSIPSEPKIRATNEEIQLDEISKKTLASYIKKASHDVATKSAATGRYAERANKEEDNRKKNNDYSGYRQGREDNKTADKMFNKSWKRRKGIEKAADKLAKDDTFSEEVMNEAENRVLHNHQDVSVVKKGKNDREGNAAIEVQYKGKKVASGDYDSGADSFFISHPSFKGQKSFDSAPAIAKHFDKMYKLSEDSQLDEMAPKGAKYERMVKHIKDKYSKDGELSDKEKSIAYATAWKAKKKVDEDVSFDSVMEEIRKNLGEAKMKKLEEDDYTDAMGNVASSSNNDDKTPKKFEKPKQDNSLSGMMARDMAADQPARSAGEQDRFDDKKIGATDVGAKTSSPAMPARSAGEQERDDEKKIGAKDVGAKPATPAAPRSAGEQERFDDKKIAPSTGGNNAPSKLPTFASGAPGTPKITPTAPAPSAGAGRGQGPQGPTTAPERAAAALNKTNPAPSSRPTPTPPPRPSAAKPAAPAAAKDDIWDDSKIQRTGEGGMETAADFNRNQDLYKQRMAAGGQRPAPSSAPSAPAKPAAPAAPSAPARPAPSSSSGIGSVGPRPSAPLPQRRPTAPNSAYNSYNPMSNASVAESFNDTIMKVLKG